MKKLIPLIFGLMLPLYGAYADNFVDEAVAFCRSKGGSYSMGSMVEEGNKYCRQVTCKKTTSERYEIPEGAPGPEANVEATKRVCVDKSVVDGSFNTAGSGSDSGSGDGSNSPGVPAGATSGATSGSSSGSTDDGYRCEELIGEGRIEKGGLCYNECRPKRSFPIFGRKKEGFERKSCVTCLLKYPGVYSVKAEYLPKDKNGKVIGDKSVSLGKGVGVKTGVIICKDSKGNTVHVNGTMCPPGSHAHGGTISSGNGGIVVGPGAGIGAGGTIIIGGGIGGGLQRPAYCNSDKRKDLKLCEEWMRVNGQGRFNCSSSSHASGCVDGYHETMSRYDTQNCVNCGVGSRRQSTLSGIAEIVGAIAPPLAQFGSAWVGARAHERSNQAWAGAAVKGFEQCQISQNNYMQYLSANELPGLSPAQQAAMGCNGYQLGGFAGMQNPGLGGWYGAGYSPGMIGGMMGPYGGYDPYGGMGMGGMVGGMAGGYPGGYAGGMVNGISLAGGINAGGMTGGYAGGYPGGYAGGMVSGGMMTGGYAGGYPGGYAGGMATGGYAGGYPGGYAGGMAGGMVNGISLAGGVNGGYAGGYAGGMSGGYPGGYMAGGMVGGGGYAGGIAGGYAGGYAGGMAGGYAGGYAGGMAGGTFQASNQAANRDAMYQQQGMMNQVGIVTGAGSPYGAGGYPMNGGFGAGMYGGGW